MKKVVLNCVCLIGLFTLVFSTVSCNKKEQRLNIIPRIQHYSAEAGVYSGKLDMVFTDSHITENMAVLWQNTLKMHLNTTNDYAAEEKGVFLKTDKELKAEEYKVRINDKGITVKASGDKGFFYALQSLRQVNETRGNLNNLSHGKWHDYPRFNWRGLHLDVSRHFYGVEKIKELLDWMAFYKMNRFHWHLVDDQGWRIEIKKYPLLTSIGSVRTETEGATYGPFFYTQEEIKEVVKYAADRYIEVIPEIELPGHTTSVLAAYPSLSCTSKKMRTGNVWGVYPDVYCAGKETAFHFLENILDEVVELFPAEYIHIGGDECPKDRWNECPKCQHRIKTEKLKNESELQAYFIKRIADFLKGKDRKIIGWDEIMEGNLADDAVVMSWHGTECGEIAVRNGNPAIMTPRDYVYFDKYQGDKQNEPLAIGGYIPLKKVYSLNPMPEGLSKKEQSLVLGVQCNLWTEHVKTEEHLEYMLMPRMVALAETAWSSEESKDWVQFENNLKAHYAIFDKWGINYHIPIPQGESNHIVILNKKQLNFSSQDGEIMIAINGGNPEKLKNPFWVDNSQDLTLFTQLESGKTSHKREIRVEKVKPLKSVVPEMLQGPGLRAEWLVTDKNESSLNLSDWKNTIKVKEPADARKLLANNQEGFIRLSGYIKVPETAVYSFQGHPEWLKVDEHNLLECKNRAKRIIYSDQVALEKGWHKIEALFRVQKYLSMPASKVKTTLEWKWGNNSWSSIKSNCFITK
ncbi:hypothetical protein EMN47_01275 [Prolixibacteraceae bacterium JC049]|nr:hypothetical protein [Prolixibacteraceae bacterium JC049]